MRPASGVSGECYTLEDRLDHAMESEDDDQDGVHDEEDDDEIDPEDGKPAKLGQITTGWPVRLITTGCLKRRETKQHPSILPGPAVPDCCLVSYCFLCDIHSNHSVVSCSYLMRPVETLLFGITG